MPIVTISRTFGAGGSPIGLILAKRMGAEFVDRKIVAAVAARSGISEAEARGYDEQVRSVWQRVAAALTAGRTELAAPLPPTDEADAGMGVEERLARLTRAAIEEDAAHGNAVIVGRGGAFILRGHPNALHVQVHAPLETRVRNLLAQTEELPEGARPDEASIRQLCGSIDAQRAEYLRRLFGVNWLDSAHYDLSIDTQTFTFEAAADLIELALQRLRGQSDAPTTATTATTAAATEGTPRVATASP
jgi:CMP/dCMP kinase